MSLQRDTNSKLWRVIKNYKQRSLSEKIAKSILIISGILLLTVGGIAKGDVETTSNIVLNTTSHRLLAINTPTPEIIVGESKVGKEARLQAEAEAARVKAEQEATAAKIKAAEAKTRKYTDPSSFDEIYQGAGQMFGVDPKLIQAVHMVETGASGSTMRNNPSGATGPMQFLPSTFARHGVDGNNDGIKDIGNVYDAIYSGARYLHDCGYPDVKRSLWGYNPSKYYFVKVMGVYDSL
ncbi:MAG: lytic transglycosylase domain-containing protein [Candidatus Berkelbacteria bacterium]